MKKRLCITILLLFLMTFVSCKKVENYYNIEADTNVYNVGTQTVIITPSTFNQDAPSVKFKPSITTNDIVLSEALEGKKVTKVEYKSETEIVIEISGTTKEKKDEGVYGAITIKNSGLNSAGNSICHVTVLPPNVYVSQLMTTNLGTTYTIYTSLSLHVGTFNELSEDSITLTDASTGALSFTLNNNVIEITIENCNTITPTLLLKKEVTSFNKEVTIKIVSGGSTNLQ